MENTLKQEELTKLPEIHAKLHERQAKIQEGQAKIQEEQAKIQNVREKIQEEQAKLQNILDKFHEFEIKTDIITQNFDKKMALQYSNIGPLRKLCKNNNLSSVGKKQELIERLEAANVYFPT